ncbi:MAG: glycosyl hydrolase [Clostridia bacterium]
MEDKKEIVRLFENPGTAFRGRPFWSWNGELKKEELLRQLPIIKEMGFGGFFMHSRAGLMTEYLGEEWFDLVNTVADEGEKLGLEAWLYDEDRWPSGSAGGKVTVDPQYRMKSMVLYGYDSAVFDWEKEIPGKEGNEVIAVFAAYTEGNSVFTYTVCETKEALRKALQDTQYNKVLVFRIVPDAPASVYNGTTYIDTMSRKAVDRFIELTHEAYKQHCGNRIGTSIKGIFTDEPHRGHMLDDYRVENGVEICSAAYTDDLFAEFAKRYGYDLKPLLPELFYRKDGGKVSKIKLDFVDLGNNLFIERFADPIKEWCEKNNMVFTGHVLHEDTLTNQTVPNGSLMRFYPHMTYPGIDLLTEHNKCYWVVKQLSSAARQAGQKWMLSELYGCTGWQFDFRAHKAVGDWQALLGINMRCHHLSWYTMEGESKRDYPASIFHQSPYYKDYDYVETYFARFAVVMTQGAPVCDLLVLNPIESAWAMMYPGWAKWVYAAPDNQDELQLEKQYEALFHMLMGSQLDFDYGEEYLMQELYSVGKDAAGKPVLRIGKASYHTVVVSGMMTMRASTVKILKEFLEAGGKVVFSGAIPEYVDGLPSGLVRELAGHRNAAAVPFEKQALTEEIRKTTAFYPQISGGGAENVFAQVRYDAANRFLYAALLNTDRDTPAKALRLSLQDAEGNFAFTEGSLYAEEWDLASGRRIRKALSFRDGVPFVTFDLEAAGEKIFVFTREQDLSAAEPEQLEEIQSAPLSGAAGFAYELDEKNVCVLDFAKWKFRNGDWQPEEEVLRVDAKIRDEAGIEHRSGGMLQPWYAKKYCDEAYGDLEVEYEFYADAVPKGEVFLAGERPEFCQYYVNGTRLECADPNDFWIDVCFRKMAVPAGLIQKGRNIVTFKTLFRRTTNIEALYLVGDFGVRIEGRRRILDRLPERIGFQNLREYRLPFYTGRITYRVPNTAFSAFGHADRILLCTDGYRGSLVKVAPLGNCGAKSQAEILAWEPYAADVTAWVKSGCDIGVTLVCSRRNVFGPLHLLPAECSVYGPEHFVTKGENWSDDYALINSSIYGMTIRGLKKK